MNRRAFIASLPFVPLVAKAALTKATVPVINPEWVKAGSNADVTFLHPSKQLNFNKLEKLYNTLEKQQKDGFYRLDIRGDGLGMFTGQTYPHKMGDFIRGA